MFPSTKLDALSSKSTIGTQIMLVDSVRRRGHNITRPFHHVGGSVEVMVRNLSDTIWRTRRYTELIGLEGAT